MKHETRLFADCSGPFFVCLVHLCAILSIPPLSFIYYKYAGVRRQVQLLYWTGQDDLYERFYKKFPLDFQSPLTFVYESTFHSLDNLTRTSTFNVSGVESTLLGHRRWQVSYLCSKMSYKHETTKIWIEIVSHIGWRVLFGILLWLTHKTRYV